MTINDPILVDTLAGLHDTYEHALQANDVVALNAFFWDSPHVVRYGVAEELYGADELRAYRQGHTPPFTSRRLVRRVITTFGPALASVMSEIEMVIDSVPRRSRQSQTWVQIPDVGWRIVAAHVSVPLAAGRSAVSWPAYADAMASAIGLTLGAHRPGVVANLERTAAIAAPFLTHELPDAAELAGVFKA